MRAVLADVFLGLAVVVVLASSAGILVMRGAYRKLHYVTPVALVAPLLVGFAVLIQSGCSGNSAQTWLALLFVIIAIVVLIRTPVRQVIALSGYGLVLALLFLAFQAPDMTLSELTVGAVILPVLLLLTLMKVRQRDGGNASDEAASGPRRRAVLLALLRGGRAATTTR